MQRILAMFTGGKRGSGPVASRFDRVASEASDGLLVDAVDAIKTVMTPPFPGSAWGQVSP